MLSKNEVDSNSGFFKESHVRFRQSLTDGDIKNFSNLTTDKDRFLFVLKKHASRDSLFCVKQEEDKNVEKALDFKDQGNKAFQNGSYNQALYFYTKALQLFSDNEESLRDLAVTRANRSAALYHMEKFQEALKDINLAIKDGYPKDLLYKIKDRKAKCLLALKQHKEALKTFKETIAALDDAKLKPDAKQKWQRDIQIMISMMTKLPAKDEKIVRKVSEEEKLKGNANPIYKAASDAVSINKNKIEGRYAVASRNIGMGDTILLEPPYCAVLLQEYAPTNCFQCFRRVLVGEPCPGCSNVLFCSAACLKKANSTHHKIECKVLKTLWQSGLSITCLMALRVITQNTLEYFKNQDLKETDNIETDDGYNSLDYKNIYNLVRHESQRKPEDMLHRANVAVFLFQCLKAGNYFNEQGDEETETFIGSLLLRHLQILQFNAHEVSELRVQKRGYSTCTSAFIGGAVFPTLALFNHSCNPSITRYFNGTSVVARAIKNIKKGEKISENYGPIFTQTKRVDRQITLKNQYWFDCNCEACTYDWPIMDDMDVTTLPLRCIDARCGNVVKVPLTTTNCMLICSKCGRTNNIMKGLKVLQNTENVFRLGMAYLDDGDAENALKKFLELYKLVDDVLVPPFKDYHLCQQAIRTCFLARGNIYKQVNN